MIRPVSDYEGWSIIDLVRRIGSSLGGDASRMFEKKVEALEIDNQVCAAHHFIERTSRPMMMFRSSEVPGVSRFVPLPEGVPELSWPVQLTERGMSGRDLDDFVMSVLSRNGGYSL